MKKKEIKKFVKDLEKFVEKHGCSIETDNYGQIVIYTGMMQDDDGTVTPYKDANEEAESVS